MLIRLLSVLTVSLVLCGSVCLAGTNTLSKPPEDPEPGQHYMSYLHGAWLERSAIDMIHPTYGRYEYDEIVEAFETRGFIVISEIRDSPVDTETYARKIASQIKELLEKDIPPENITVIGHSKGGYMTLLVSTMLHQPKVNFVVLAGGGRKGTRFGVGFERFVKEDASSLQGRVLSLYDLSDRIAGSCEEAFDKADDETLESKEIVLVTGNGHGLFFRPESIWIEPVIEWVGNIESVSWE